MNTEAAGGDMTTYEGGGMAQERYRWSEEDCALYDGDEIVICCLAQDDLGPVIAAALNSRERLVAALERIASGGPYLHGGPGFDARAALKSAASLEVGGADV